jgi:hypothetical protein
MQPSTIMDLYGLIFGIRYGKVNFIWYLPDTCEVTKPHFPEYHVVRIDESQHWDKEFLTYIGEDAKIISTYVFNHASATHCCELTPSYELYLVSTTFTVSEELSDEARDEIQERINSSNIDAEEVQYFHCRAIEGQSVPINQFVECEAETSIDEVREYILGNPCYGN